jgi:hypothetical protein
VDPRAGLDIVEKRNFLILPGLELGPLGRPARSQSLYRLRYPRSPGCRVVNENSMGFTRKYFVKIAVAFGPLIFNKLNVAW